MDTTITSRASPQADLYVPKVAAKTAGAENPVEKTVIEAKAVSPSPAREKKAPAERKPALSDQENVEGGYVALPNETFAYQIVDKGSNLVLEQLPSEQALQMRAYLDQQDAKRSKSEDQHALNDGILA